MTKNEFTDALNECNNQIKDLQEKKKSLEKEYIESNATFKIGDKVKVTHDGNSEIDYVIGFEIGFGNKIHPLLRKANKNGKMSSVGKRIVPEYYKIINI